MLSARRTEPAHAPRKRAPGTPGNLARELMQRITILLLVLLGGCAFVALYLYGSFGLVGNARVTAYSSGIFDMDVGRIVYNLSSDAKGIRTPVHPLIKIFMLPVVGLVRAIGGTLENPLNAMRLIIALSMAANSLLCGWLASQLCHGRLLPGIAAALISACSFSALLLGSIPETASLSALSTVVPLVYLNHRHTRPFSWGEALVWSLIAVFCITFTVTQIVHFLIAIGARGYLARRHGEPLGRALVRAPWPKLASLVLVFAILSGGLAELQRALYRDTPVFYHGPGIAHEQRYIRLGLIASEPVRHTASVFSQLLIYDFAAPRPGFSDNIPFFRNAPFWSISLEETRPSQWTAWHWLVIALLCAALVIAAASLRRANLLFLAPALSVSSQFALHYFYGREYVLYSGNWHGVLVALLVAATFRAFPRHGVRCATAASLLAALLLANNLATLDWVYRQVESGLEASLRDGEGELLAHPPPGVRPAGAVRWP